MPLLQVLHFSSSLVYPYSCLLKLTLWLLIATLMASFLLLYMAPPSPHLLHYCPLPLIFTDASLLFFLLPFLHLHVRIAISLVLIVSLLHFYCLSASLAEALFKSKSDGGTLRCMLPFLFRLCTQCSCLAIRCMLPFLFCLCTQCSMLNVQCSMINAQCSKLMPCNTLPVLVWLMFASLLICTAYTAAN